MLLRIDNIEQVWPNGAATHVFISLITGCRQLCFSGDERAHRALRRKHLGTVAATRHIAEPDEMNQQGTYLIAARARGGKSMIKYRMQKFVGGYVTKLHEGDIPESVQEFPLLRCCHGSTSGISRRETADKNVIGFWQCRSRSINR